MGLNKLKNLFKIGIKTKTLSNKLITASFVGKKGQPVLLYAPYGMFCNPADDVPVGLLADQGNEESILAFPFDIENRETMGSGEIAFGIPGKTARLKFFDNDKIALYNSLTSMLVIMKGLIDEVKSLTTSGSAVSQAVSAVSQASLEAYKLEVEKLLNGS